MTLEEAIEWCIKNQADVKFYYVQNVGRVSVRIGGYFAQERYTLAEAVYAVERQRSL